MITKFDCNTGAVLLAIIVILSTSSPAEISKKCGVEQLPAKARALLLTKFPEWHIVETKDLLGDDRNIWIKAHHDACPGIAKGNFEGGQPTYAVSLIRRKANRLWQALVVLSDKDQVFVARVLDPPSEVARPLVISRLPPGKYSSAEGDTIAAAKFDVIQEEAIEAGATVFYWKNGEFHRIVVSE